MKRLWWLGGLGLVFFGLWLWRSWEKAEAARIHPPGSGPESLHAFTMPLLDGSPMPLASYSGQILLVVNVASRCGFTGQYAGLQRLHEKYAARGFSVLGFPANDFMGQEPGTNQEIASFCRATYGVSFPIFAKISVKGPDQHPLYGFLTDEVHHPGFGGPIAWNFTKFLIDRAGKVIGRFGSRIDPESPELIAAIERALTL
jgi:glutathione peroxidase